MTKQERLKQTILLQKSVTNNSINEPIYEHHEDMEMDKLDVIPTPNLIRPISPFAMAKINSDIDDCMIAQPNDMSLFETNESYINYESITSDQMSNVKAY